MRKLTYNIDTQVAGKYDSDKNVCNFVTKRDPATLL